MEELNELFKKLQINDITVIDELFMKKIYEMKQNSLIYDEIYDGDSIYNINEYKKDEIIEFLDNLNIKTFEAIQSFLMNTPKLRHVIVYKNSLGNERKITLESLNDFFSLR